MKSFKLIESSIIGLLIGVVVSVYILFMDTVGRDIGSILKTVSLGDFIKYFPAEYRSSIVFNFLFYIIVYILYVVILNLLFRIHKKLAVVVSIIIVILCTGSAIQQVNAFKKPLAIDEPVVEIGNFSSSNIKKYFGEETKGDLNQDQVDDVAFLIKRNEGDERGDMYYLSASLKTNQGYGGLNLVYVGEKIIINSLTILEGTIIIEYKENDSDEVNIYKAKVENNTLIEIEEDTESVSEE
ncbi:MAG: hypothetical protein RLZZ517_596 [Candidatus Parcubacteria bacterium]|jgi:hypothetical protein